MATIFPGSFQVRRKSAATWTAENYILRAGEMGLETDTDKFKFGNGVSGYNSLPYAGGGTSTSAAAVSVPYASTIPLDTIGAGKVMPETILSANTAFSVDAAPVSDGTCQLCLVGDGAHSPDLSIFTNGNAYTYSNASGARNLYVFVYTFGTPIFAGVLLPSVDSNIPTLVSATVDDIDATKLQLVWSEAMDATAISASAAFAVIGHALTAHTHVDATHTYLTTSVPFTQGETVTLAYTVPGSLAMKDLAGNQVAAFAGKPISINVTNPQISSAVVANSTPTKIDLTWSDAILSTSIPAAAAFAVSSGHAITAHAYVDSTHTQLTTSTAFTSGEGAKTLSYTVPVSNPIKDQQVISNLGLAITGKAITNNVAGASGPAILRGTPTFVSNSTHPQSATKPTGVVATDLILAIQTSDQTPQLLTGFTSIGTITSGFVGNHFLFSYKIAGGSEPSTYSFDTVSGTGTHATALTAFSGPDGTTPVEGWASTSTNNNATFTAASFVASIANDVDFLLFFDDINGTQTVATPPAGFTLLGLSSGLSMGTFAIYGKTVAAGATGTAAIVWNSATWGIQASMGVRSATP